MQTIQPIQIENATGPMLRILEALTSEQSAFLNEEGALSNMLKTMAQSRSAVEGYVQLSQTLAQGALDAKLREQIALAVAQANRSEYSLAQHASVARTLGLTKEEISASREGRAGDAKTRAALQFAQSLVNQTGACEAGDLRKAGYSDPEIVEIVTQVALDIFENIFNTVAKTDIDFPRIGALAVAA